MNLFILFLNFLLYNKTDHTITSRTLRQFILTAISILFYKANHQTSRLLNREYLEHFQWKPLHLYQINHFHSDEWVDVTIQRKYLNANSGYLFTFFSNCTYKLINSMKWRDQLYKMIILFRLCSIKYVAYDNYSEIQKLYQKYQKIQIKTYELKMNMFAFLKKKQTKQKLSQKKGIQIDIKKAQHSSKKKNLNKVVKQALDDSSRREDTQFNLIPRIKKQKTLQKMEQRTPKIINRAITELQNQETSKLQKKIYNIDKFQEYQEDQNSKQGQHYEQISFKHCIQLKKILSKLEFIYKKVQSEYELIQNAQEYHDSKQMLQIKKQLNLLRNSHLFRFQQNFSILSIKQRYSQIIQSCELLISKLVNRIGKNIHFHIEKKDKLQQQKLTKVYVANQQQFLLFFKHFFSKPYKLCNRPAIRKVLQIIWEYVSLQNFNVQVDVNKLMESLKLWIYYISVPSNPTLITLHKLAIQNPSLIPKYVKMVNNQKIYLGINQSDAIGLTPLMLAAYASSKKGLQKLLKCGADPLTCPLYISQGKLQSSSTVTKYDKNLFTINYPIHMRKQFNFLQILLNMKQYKLLSQCFYWIQLGQIKKFKKDKQILRQKLNQIPDCSFQIVWKTFKGILCFKQLPSDIVTVYKKNSMLRLDFHIDNIETPQKGKHYTLIIKAQKDRQVQFYEIRHHSKKIINRLKQVDMKQIFKKYQQFIKFPHLKYEKMALAKGIYSFELAKGQNQKTLISLNTQFYSEVLPYKQSKEFRYLFKNSQQYQSEILNSDLVNYNQIQKSQLSAIINQKVLNINHPNLKNFIAKKQKSSLNLEIQLENTSINLTHLKTLISLFSKNSLIIQKLEMVLDMFLNQDIFKNNQRTKTKQVFNLREMFPKSIKLHLDNSFNFQINFQNINYSQLKDSIFNIECHLKQQEYLSQGDQILDSLHSTIIMDDGYSINVSRFLGKTERMFQFEEQQALKKFEDILQGNIISQVVSDEEDNYFSKQ